MREIRFLRHKRYELALRLMREREREIQAQQRYSLSRSQVTGPTTPDEESGSWKDDGYDLNR